MDWNLIAIITIICITINLIVEEITDCIENNDRLFWENYDKFMEYNNFNNIENEEEDK